MSKREDMLICIGEKIIDKLFELNNDYNYEADEYGFYSASYGVQFSCEYGNAECEVECSVFWNGSSSSIECLIYGCEGIHKKRYKKLERVEKAVQEYLEKNLDTDELLNVMEDDIRDANMDEWQLHGFRDAADYYHYRYG